MRKHCFDCSKMTDDISQEYIQSYIKCGWKFIGYSNFPPPHIWACFDWDKDSEPIYPNQKEQK